MRLLYDGSRQNSPPQLWAQPAVPSAAALAAALLFCLRCVPSSSEPSTASRRVASPKRRCAQRTAGTQGILRCTHIDRISAGLRVDRQSWGAWCYGFSALGFRESSFTSQSLDDVLLRQVGDQAPDEA